MEDCILSKLAVEEIRERKTPNSTKLTIGGVKIWVQASLA